MHPAGLPDREPCGAAADAAVASFDDMPLSRAVLRGVYSYGFEQPSPIQQRAIVPLVRGRDVVAQAQSGTGKTGAFSIGLLQRVDASRRALQGLVLSPTRELAQQTHDVVSRIGAHVACDGVRLCGLFVGGTKVQHDLVAARCGVVVAVGTPGRIADLVQRGALVVRSLVTVVLDEADEMLSQGFAAQVQSVFRFVPRDVQVGLFSATLPPDVQELAATFMRSPSRILVDRGAVALQGIGQYRVEVEERYKLATLLELYEAVPVSQSVVFVNTCRRARWIAERLADGQHTVGAIHSEMSREEREQVMQVFRRGSLRVLVATDLVARGIDVHNVSTVVNFDVPLHREVYLHRIGRCGRYGRHGLAISLVDPQELPLIHLLEDHVQVAIPELPADLGSLVAAA